MFSEIKRSNSVLEMEADLNSLETNPTLQPQVRLERLNVFPETHHSTSPQSKSSLNDLEQFLYNQLFNNIEMIYLNKYWWENKKKLVLRKSY